MTASREDLLKWRPGRKDVNFPLLPEKQDFVDSIKSRKETQIPAGIGHRTASLCQIGHIAVRLGQKLKWNPDADQCVGNDTANQLLTRAQRAPWQVGP